MADFRILFAFKMTLLVTRISMSQKLEVKYVLSKVHSVPIQFDHAEIKRKRGFASIWNSCKNLFPKELIYPTPIFWCAHGTNTSNIYSEVTLPFTNYGYDVSEKRIFI